MKSQDLEKLKIGIYTDSGDWRSLLEQLRAEAVTPMKGVQLASVVDPLMKMQKDDLHLLAIELLKQVRKECWTGWTQFGTAAEQILIRALMLFRSEESAKEARQRYKALQAEAEKNNRYARNAIDRLSKLF